MEPASFDANAQTAFQMEFVKMKENQMSLHAVTHSFKHFSPQKHEKVQTNRNKKKPHRDIRLENGYCAHFYRLDTGFQL